MNLSTRQIVKQSQPVLVQFLIADLSVALTFPEVAETSQSEATQLRNRQHARSAYDTVFRLLDRVSPLDEERFALDAKIAQLRDRLLGLGYQLDPFNSGPKGS